jgi:hypothetical protein
MSQLAAFAGAGARLGRVLAVFWLASMLSAQVAWEERSPSAPARFVHAMAYDVARGRTVLFGGANGPAAFGDTWEWDGAHWARGNGNGPPARVYHALAHDLARNRTVLFGGYSGGGSSSGGHLSNDTWEWDGTVWTQIGVQGPPARMAHALAYDALRGRTVLFSGQDSSATVFFADTWEWDGVSWLQRAPAQSPPPRSLHALAYDLLRGRTVLFGGSASITFPPAPYADTWEWDGAGWTQRTPAQSPPARSGHGLAFDLVRGRTVLFGGSGFADTWEWDGTTWFPRAPAQSPPARYGHALAYDALRSRTVLFGGQDQTTQQPFADTWEWDGSAWTQVGLVPAPPPRRWAPLGYDATRGRTVLFGGPIPSLNTSILLAATWDWDGTVWLQRTPAQHPSARYAHAFAHDRARGRTVLFGGRGGGAAHLGDTWEWDGTTWTAPVALGPPARGWHALAFDSARSRVVLFGGTNFVVLFADTWEWDDAVWLQRAPALSPPARQSHALAYDALRSRTVTFSGITSAPLLPADTWEWDGTNWTQRFSAAVPPPRYEHALAYDSARGRTVLFDGIAGTSLSDTWEWDGVNWLPRTPSQSPPRRSAHGLAFDSARARTVMFGSASLGDTWEYAPADPGTYAPFGTGCAGSAGALTLAARAGLMPYPGNTVTVDVAPVPPNVAVIRSFGLSRTQWGTIALPFDLTSLGMPGCTLLASGDSSRLVFAAGNTASFSFPIPNDQAFVGFDFYNQAFALDPAANAAGVVASNAAQVHIGSK